MPEAGHESVEEDRRDSFSEGLFRVHLRRLHLESSRRSLTLLQSASELADKTNCQHDGRESTKSRSPRPAARKCAPRVISNAKERSRCLAIVTLVRPIASPSIISSERGRRAFDRACYDFAFTTDESIQGALSVGSGSAGARSGVSLFSKGTFSAERYSRLRLLAGDRQRRIVILRSFVASFLVRDRRASLHFYVFERQRDGTKCVPTILTNQEIKRKAVELSKPRTRSRAQESRKSIGDSLTACEPSQMDPRYRRRISQ
jgi:hypothetical protein